MKTPAPHPADPFVQAALTGVAGLLPTQPTADEIDDTADAAVRLGRAAYARQYRAPDSTPQRVTED